MNAKYLLAVIILSTLSQLNIHAQSCTVIQGQYNFTETTALTATGHGVTEQYAIVERGTIQITQTGCSISYHATEVSGDPEPFAGNGDNITRYGTISGNKITLSGTSLHPLDSLIRMYATSEQTSATGTISGTTIQIQGKGDVNTSIDVGIHFNWTSAATLNLIQTVPSIASQPTNATVNAGASVSFVAVAVGTEPLTYQWRRNGVNISSATGSVLTLNNLTVEQAGDYSVVVSNTAGSVTSQSARLTVNPAGSSGGIWTEDWEGAAIATYVPTKPGLVLITTAKGKWVLSDTASHFEQLHGPTPNRAQVLVQDGSKALKLMSNLRTDGTSSGNIYVGLLPAISPVSIPLVAKTRISMVEKGALVNPQNSWGFACIVPPCADTVHLDLVDNRGNQVTYIFQRAVGYTEHTVANLGSTGRGYTEVFLPVEGGTFTRNLFDDFSRIPGWLPNNASVVQIGFVVDDTGWASLDDLKIGEGVPTLPPSITGQPQSQGVALGTNISLRVTASGTAPLRYQWLVAATPIADATNDTLSLEQIQPGDAGGYRVVVSNAAGVVTSAVAVLSVYLGSIEPSTIYFGPQGGASNVVVFATDGRSWSTLNTNAWIVLSPGSDGGIGDGVVSFTAQPNASLVTRTGTLNIAGRTFAVIQAAAEIIKPTVGIAYPTANLRLSEPAITVRGTAWDNAQVMQVQYQFNGGSWDTVTILNSHSNWTASVTLVPGINTFRVYSQDTSGNRSLTNTVSFTYVVTAPLVMQTNGNGTVSPNYNGQMLEVGKSYSMTAKAATGFMFTNWTGSVPTNGATVKFIMAANLVLTANFVDIQKPTISITNVAKTYTNSQIVTISATASDNVGVTLVEFYDGAMLKSSDSTAAYTYEWPFTAVDNGAHVWTARAYDAAGNSRTSSPVVLMVSIDITPPTVVISSPTNGATRTTSPVTISGTASDPGSPSSGLARVEVRVNGGSWTNATGTGTWTRSVALAPCENMIEARSRDNAGNYSVVASKFVIYTPPNNVPKTPINVSPASGATGVSLTPTLQASVFSDPDCLGDTHAASQWQVLNSVGAVVVADSGTNTANLTSWIVPANKLYYGSNYQWRVRYRDSRNGWSSNSTPTTFITGGPLLIGTPLDTSIVLKWPTNALGFTLQGSKNLEAANWSNALPSPVIVSGQYTVTNSMTNDARFYRLRK